MRSTQEPGEQSFFGLTLDEWSRALSLALRETASVVAVSAMPASAIKGRFRL